VKRCLWLAVLLLPLSLGADDRFTSSSMNFSVATPGRDWQWQLVGSSDGGGGVWAVDGPAGEQFSISVSSIGYFRISETWLRAFGAEIVRDGARHGYRVEAFHCDHRDSPLRSSYSFSYVRVDAGGERSFVDGYIGATNRVYTLQYISRSRAALLEFRRVVDSFRIADKLQAQRGSAMETGATTFPGLAALGLDTFLSRPIAPNGTPTASKQ